VATKIIHYDVGDLWTPQATFTVGGVNTDPTNLTIRQEDASGAQTILLNTVAVSGLNAGTSPVAKTGTGVFKLNPGITLSSSGHWFVKFEGTGAATATEQQEAIVDPDEFTLQAGIASYALVGLSETKDWLRHQNIDTSDDLALVRTINDMSARFAEEADREFKVFGTNPLVRVFDIDEQSIWRREISVGDLTSFTQVRIMDELGNVIQTPSLSDVISIPRVRRTWDSIRTLRFTQNVVRLWSGPYPYVVEVTGTWGFPAVPGNVRQAVLDAVVAAMDRDVENYRDDLSTLSSGAESGNVIVIGGGGARVLSLPPASIAVA